MGEGKKRRRNRSCIALRTNRDVDGDIVCETAGGRGGAADGGLQADLAIRRTAGIVHHAVARVQRLGKYQYGDQGKSCRQRGEHGGSIA